MINPQSRSPQNFQERGADHFKFLRPSRFVVADDNHDAIVAERMRLKGSLTRAPHLAHVLPQRVPRAIQNPITNPAAVTIRVNTSPPSTGPRPNRRRLATNTPTPRDATISTLRIRAPTCGRLAGIAHQHATITARLRPAITAGSPPFGNARIQGMYRGDRDSQAKNAAGDAVSKDEDEARARLTPLPVFPGLERIRPIVPLTFRLSRGPRAERADL